MKTCLTLRVAAVAALLTLNVACDAHPVDHSHPTQAVEAGSSPDSASTSDQGGTSADTSQPDNTSPSADAIIAEAEEDVNTPDPKVCEKLKVIEGKWYAVNEGGDTMDWAYTNITLTPEATTCKVHSKGKEVKYPDTTFYGTELPLIKPFENGEKAEIMLENNILYFRDINSDGSIGGVGMLKKG